MIVRPRGVKELGCACTEGRIDNNKKILMALDIVFFIRRGDKIWLNNVAIYVIYEKRVEFSILFFLFFFPFSYQNTIPPK